MRHITDQAAAAWSDKPGAVCAADLSDYLMQVTDLQLAGQVLYRRDIPTVEAAFRLMDGQGWSVRVGQACAYASVQSALQDLQNGSAVLPRANLESLKQALLDTGGFDKNNGLLLASRFLGYARADMASVVMRGLTTSSAGIDNYQLLFLGEASRTSKEAALLALLRMPFPAEKTVRTIKDLILPAMSTSWVKATLRVNAAEYDQAIVKVAADAPANDPWPDPELLAIAQNRLHFRDSLEMTSPGMSAP